MKDNGAEYSCGADGTEQALHRLWMADRWGSWRSNCGSDACECGVGENISEKKEILATASEETCASGRYRVNPASSSIEKTWELWSEPTTESNLLSFDQCILYSTSTTVDICPS